MRLLINSLGVSRSSRGVQRYAASVLSHLQWPGGVQALQPRAGPVLSRAREVFTRGPSDAIIWTPCQRGPLLAPRHVVTVHDCISIEYTYRGDWRLPAYLCLMGEVLRRAAAVVAISETTRNAILRNFRLSPERITVIRSAVDVAWPVPEGAAQGAPAIDGQPFVLLVTNDLPHKNTLAACRAFGLSRASRDGVALHVVGSLPPAARAACDAAGVRLRVVHGVDDGELARAYRDCAFLLAPSLSEGHDLPVAEALTYGAEVLCSDIPAHREFYAGCVRFFDPGDVSAMAEAIDAALLAPRPWHSPAAGTASRSFADVARDYEALFRSIERRHG